MDANEPFDLNATEAKGKGTKARKRVSAKTPTENAKRSLNLRIDDESYRRLSIHALMRNTTISALVERYAQGLREFSMPHRLGGSSRSRGSEPPAQARRGLRPAVARRRHRR